MKTATGIIALMDTRNNGIGKAMRPIIPQHKFEIYYQVAQGGIWILYMKVSSQMLHSIKAYAEARMVHDKWHAVRIVLNGALEWPIVELTRNGVDTNRITN